MTPEPCCCKPGEDAARKRLYRVVVLLIAVGAAAAVLVLKQSRTENETSAGLATTDRALPRLVDLGAGKCASCKLMTPVLAGLERDYADTFRTEFIDVWENPGAAERYGIRLIPTQIFFGAAGEELHRHEGFLSRDDILTVWRRHGVEPGPPGGRALPSASITPNTR